MLYNETLNIILSSDNSKTSDSCIVYIYSITYIYIIVLYTVYI